jgi:predicted HicB family RNase H-like nuclease
MKPKRDWHLQIRLTGSEHAALAAMAKGAGMSVSEYVRQVLFGMASVTPRRTSPTE